MRRQFGEIESVKRSDQAEGFEISPESGLML